MIQHFRSYHISSLTAAILPAEKAMGSAGAPSEDAKASSEAKPQD